MDFTKLTAYLDSLAGTYGIPAVDCKVTRGYETLYRHGAGYADPQGARPVADTDLYGVYSATKVVTAVAALQLIQQGKLSLSDRLDAYLPEFAELFVSRGDPAGDAPLPSPGGDASPARAQNPIHVLDLFRMTAGLTYDLCAAALRAYVRDNRHGGTMRGAMAAIARMPLICEPGTRWVYSLAHDVLGGLVETVSGERYGAYLQRHLFEPLEIRDMTLTPDAAQRARLSAQYQADAATGRIVPWEEPSPYRLTEAYESGGAGLYCTVNAYSLFAQALANGGVGATGNRILTSESIDLMRRNWLDERMLRDFAATGKTGYGYGLGVRTLMDASAARSPVGEFGWDGAAGAYVLIDPENRLSLFVAEHVLGFEENYRTIHPRIRDLVYEALG